MFQFYLKQALILKSNALIFGVDSFLERYNTHSQSRDFAKID